MGALCCCRSGPQTVNAYYRADSNEIAFPAAILLAPLFDAHADVPPEARIRIW